MKEEKNLLLEEVKEKIIDAPGFIITKYNNFTASRSRKFRNEIAKISGEMEVVKKRILIKVLSSLGLTVPCDVQGHIGVVVAYENPAHIAKAIMDFSKSNANVFEVLGGRIDNVIYSAEEITHIAKLPLLPELRAQFVGLLEAPMASIVRTMQAACTGVIFCMKERAEKL